jgi:hypothetical protein
MSTPLSEKLRVKIADHYVGDVRAWKSDASDERLVVAYKDAAIDPENNSLFLVNPRTGAKTYIGTTLLGKDGGDQPFVLNDGTVGFIVTEAPAPGASGSLADLFLVLLNNNVGAEPAPAAAGAYNDTALRLLIAGLNIRVTALEAHIAQLDAKLAAAKAAL